MHRFLSLVLFAALTVTLSCQPRARHQKTTASGETSVVTSANNAPTMLAMSRNYGCALYGKNLHCWRHTLEHHRVAVKAAGYYPKPLLASARETRGDVVQLVASNDFFCARAGSGVVTCWREGLYAHRSRVFDSARTIGLFRNHLCAATGAKEVECVMLDQDGKRARGARGATLARAVEDVQVGDAHACALLEDRSASCWKEEGATLDIGDGTFEDVEQLALGRGYICVLGAKGAAGCWGEGFTSSTRRSYPRNYLNVEKILSTGELLCVQQNDNQRVIHCMHIDIPDDQERVALDGLDGINHFIAPLLSHNDSEPMRPFGAEKFSSETFAIGGGRVCVIDNNHKVRCNEPNIEKHVTLRSHPPHRVDKGPVKEWREIMLVQHATWFTDQDDALWFMGNSALVHGANDDLLSPIAFRPKRAYMFGTEAEFGSSDAPEHLNGMLAAVTCEEFGQVKNEHIEVRLKTSSGWFTVGKEPLAQTMFYLDSEGAQRPAREILLTHPDSEWTCTADAKPGSKLVCAKHPLDSAIVNTFPGTPLKLIPDERREMCVLSDNHQLYCRRKVDKALVEQLHSEEIIDASRTKSTGCWVYKNNKLRCWHESSEGKRSITLEGFASVSGRGDVTCAVALDGGLHCLGDNFNGIIAPANHGEEEVFFDTFTQVEGLPPVEEVILGTVHACALTQGAPSERELWCWGDNTFGQMGAPSNRIREVISTGG